MLAAFELLFGFWAMVLVGIIGAFLRLCAVVCGAFGSLLTAIAHHTDKGASWLGDKAIAIQARMVDGL